jgi:glycosyltransferase involved in cell wall biosynthesis
LSTVSVIIPTYNRSKYLEEAVYSVLEQTCQDFEIIVVDDGSTDNTREIVENFKDLRINYIFQKNRGAGAARNSGVRAARGSLIAFLDADDAWLPVKLELQVKALKINPRCSIVYSNMYFWGHSGQKMPETFFQLLKWPPPRGKVLDKMAIRSFGHPSTLLVRREVFEQIGHFDEGLPYCDDYDMLLRMAASFEFEVVPLPLVKYRLHPDQISRNAEKVILDHLTVFEKARRLPSVSRKINRRLKSRSAGFHFQYAVFLARRGLLNRGFHELAAAVKDDFGKSCLLSLSVFGRAVRYLFKKAGPKRRLPPQYSESFS